MVKLSNKDLFNYCFYCPKYKFDNDSDRCICKMKEKYDDFQCFIPEYLRIMFSDMHNRLAEYQNELFEGITNEQLEGCNYECEL